MKMTEIKDLTPQELTAKSRDLRQEIFNLRLQQASSQLEKPGPLEDSAPRCGPAGNPNFTTPQQSRLDLTRYARRSNPTGSRPPQGTAGKVISNKMAKTIVVQVQRRFPHPQYKKVITAYSKFYAHDEKSEAKVGDMVLIQETRPLSKLKRWRLTQIVERGAEAPRGRLRKFMLQVRSILDVADNTGAKRAAAIGVIGRNQRYAGIGDVIKAHIKEAAPGWHRQEGRRGGRGGGAHPQADPPVGRLLFAL